MKILFTLYAATLVVTASAQQPITITEQTLKIGGMKTEEMFFGFAEGDQLIFTFVEAGKKELKEVEIIEYPSSTKFADYKTKAIERKIINISKTAVYKFRFYNNALSGRVCKVHIQRIPATEATTSFNTNVSWVTKQDTSWRTYTKDVVVGYDTTYHQKAVRELVKTDQREELIIDKTERVHSSTNANGNKSYAFFTLPQNKFSAYEEQKVIAWAFWIGVGEEANLAWKQNVKAITSVAKTLSGFTSPLGGLAVGAISQLVLPTIGEDVSYSVTDKQNKDLFMAGQAYKGYEHGKGVAGYKKFTDAGICRGTWFLCLSNDNIMQGINATIKVIAIVETKGYEDKQITEEKITPRYEKKMFKDPVITTATVPGVN